MNTLQTTIPFVLLNQRQKILFDFEQHLRILGFKSKGCVATYKKKNIEVKISLEDNDKDIREINIDFKENSTVFMISYGNLKDSQLSYYTPLCKIDKIRTPFWTYCFDIIKQMIKSI